MQPADQGMRHEASDPTRPVRPPAMPYRETGLAGWACETRTQKCRRKLSL
jgi:hypothetical protein